MVQTAEDTAVPPSDANSLIFQLGWKRRSTEPATVYSLAVAVPAEGLGR